MKNLLRYIVISFVALPIVAIVYVSLVQKWAYPGLFSFSLENWTSLFITGTQITTSFGLSLFISLFMAVIGTVIGFWLSKTVMFSKRLSGWIKLAFYPYVIAPVVFGAMLQFYFVRLDLLGTLGGVLVAQALFIIPYSILLLSTFWTEKIRLLSYQAETLGAGAWQTHKNVLLPMARPWLLLSFIQCFLISWFEYGITQLIGVGKVNTLTISAMHFVKEANPHQAALAGCLLILPVLFIFLINQKLITRATNA